LSLHPRNCRQDQRISIHPPDHFLDVRDADPEAAEGHAIAGGAAARAQRDPLLDIGAVDAAIAEMEDIAGDVAGHRPGGAAQAAGESVGAGADQAPGRPPRRLPFLLDDLIEHKGSARFDSASAVRAHVMAPREHDADPPLPLGVADEELLGGERLDEKQGGDGGGERQNGFLGKSL